MMIEFNSVYKEYGLNSNHSNTIKEFFSFRKCKNNSNTFIALEDVSFSIKKGNCVGILGRNGSGKSTILKLASRVTLPTEGEINIYGSVSSLLEVGAGFHPDLTGIENIFLSGAIIGLSSNEVKNKIPEIENFAELGDFLYEPVKNYSSGMSLRLAFAIGACLDSDILIIDEALAVGDQLFQEKCIERINQLKKKGVTILFVSHDIAQVRNICDQSMLIQAGKMIYFGNVDESISLYLKSLEGK